MTTSQAAARLTSSFVAADLNDDGQLSFNEAVQMVATLTVAQFDAIDGNRDGFLSRSELEAAQDSDGGEVPAGCAATKRWVGKSVGDLFLLGLSLIALLGMSRWRSREVG